MSVDRTKLAQLQQWGGPREMGGFESVMWRAEVDPRLRSSGVSMHRLDTAPDWEQLHAHHQWIVDAVPRLKQRVLEPAFDIGNPVWVEDSAFNLDYHLRRMRVPAPGTYRQMLECAQAFGATPADPARPPWEVLVIDGLEDGSAAYLLKLHHTMTDGMGVIQFFENVFANSAEPVKRPKLPRSTPEASLTPMDLARRNLRKGLMRLPGKLLRGGSGLTQAAKKLGLSRAQAQDYIRSAQRVLAGHGTKSSPLFRERSLAARYDTLDLPLAALKAAGKPHGCSLNDAILAGIIGGLGRYHQHFDMQPDTFAIGFPISLRAEHDEIGGNRFTGAQYAAPANEPDPVTRMQMIGEYVRSARNEPAVDITLKLMPLMNRLPRSLLTAATAGVTTSFDAQISNIPGHREPIYIGGARASGHYALGPRPGSAMMIAMFSYCDKFCLGINTDPAAITDPELFLQCLQDEFDVICSLGNTSSKK